MIHFQTECKLNEFFNRNNHFSLPSMLVSCKISSLFKKTLFKLKVNKNAHSEQTLLSFVIPDLFLIGRHHQDNFAIFQLGLFLQPYTKRCMLLEIICLSGVLSNILALGSLLPDTDKRFSWISLTLLKACLNHKCFFSLFIAPKQPVHGILAMCYDSGNHSAFLVMETSSVQRGAVQGAVGRSMHLPHPARVGNGS